MASETVLFGDNGANSVLPWMLASGNGGFGNGFGGWGTGIVGFLLGALFGKGFNGNGIFGGNNMGGAGYLANALNNDTGRELIMQGINGNHEAVMNLSNILHTDVASVQAALNTIALGIQNVGSQVGLSGQQIINSIQSGNASLASQLCQCCCENRLLTTEQGYQAQLRTLEQTNQLGSQADRNAAAITGAIKDQSAMIIDQFCQARERDMQAQIDKQAETISILRGQIDNAAQTQQILGAVNGLIAPLQKQVSEIAAKQPNTVSVQYPNLAAVNMTPYVSGGYYQGGFNGFYGGGAPGFNF